MKHWALVLWFVLLGGCGMAQGFLNLNFESASIVPDPASFFPGSCYASNAIAGWTGYMGTNQVSDVLYDSLTLGSVSIDIEDTNSAYFGSSLVIQGRYTIVLQAGVGGGIPYPTDDDASIAQTGLIPASARSLLFEANFEYTYPNQNSFQVLLGGQNLNVFALSSNANYTLYGADIVAFAGQVQTLEFSSETTQGDVANALFLDDIQFSPMAVPEPATPGLVAIGGLFFVIRRRRKIIKM